MLRLICLFTLTVFEFGVSELSFAHELHLGMTAADESDDRLRPGLTFGFNYDESIISQIYLLSRSLGPVSESTQAIAVAKPFPIFNAKGPLIAAIGGTFIRENTSVKASTDGTDSSDAVDDSSYNLGLFTKVELKLVTLAPVIFHVSWDSHLFLAGQAGLFLATGRKQFFSLSAGVVW